ncbi:MAG: DUF3225 domain-containing protein [Pyrinomonadaceae bacterium]|nr:DUF3225 domain-containing protein [Pyrinomonadaceae bacterium]
MKKINRILGSGFVLVMICVAVSAQQSKRETKIKEDIRAVMNAQVVEWNKGSINGFMQGYWNSPETIFVSGNSVTKGWQTVLDRYKKNYDSPEKMGKLTFADLEITVLSKDSAAVLGSWILQREKDTPYGRFTLVFRKTADGWRIIHDHTS